MEEKEFDKTLAEVIRIATEADMKATEAKAGLGYHEDLCAERYEYIRREQKEAIQGINAIHSDMTKRWDQFWGRMWKLAGTVIVMLLGILATMVSYVWMSKIG